MRDGVFNTYKVPLGFRLVNGKLEIQQGEADVVRIIFEYYLSGMNSREIAEIRNRQSVLRKVWRGEMVDYILKNERYAGNALLQRRYTTESFPTKKK